MCAIAKSYIAGASTLSGTGRSYNCSRDSVRASLALVCNAGREADVLFAKRLAEELQASTQKLAMVIFTWAYDEQEINVRRLTKACLRPDRDKENKSAETSSTTRMIQDKVQNCVSRVFVTWAFEDGEAGGHEFQLPPVRLYSTCAEALWYAMRDHKLSEHVNELREAFQMRAAQDKAFYFEIHPSDDAKANERFVAAVQTVQTATSSRSRDGDNRQSCEQCRCCSHQNHLGLLDVVTAVFGLTLANALYCTSMFFRMGSYYGRCTLELHRYLAFEDRVRFYPGVQVPDEDMALSKSILAYLKDTALFREHDLLSGRKTGGLYKQMAKLLSVWTGGYKKSGTFCLYGCRADTREEAIWT